MMPTFPPLSLKFRTAGFPQYGFKAGYQTAPSHRQRVLRVVRLASVLRAPRFLRLILVLSRGARRAGTPPFKRPLPLYPRGPRSGPGCVVPVHHRLTGPMRPTRRHNSISPHSGLYALPSLCAATSAPKRPASGSVLSLAFFLDMSSSRTTGSSSAVSTQFLHR